MATSWEKTSIKNRLRKANEAITTGSEQGYDLLYTVVDVEDAPKILGFQSLNDFARQQLGMSPRSFYYRMRVARIRAMFRDVGCTYPPVSGLSQMEWAVIEPSQVRDIKLALMKDEGLTFQDAVRSAIAGESESILGSATNLADEGMPAEVYATLIGIQQLGTVTDEKVLKRFEAELVLGLLALTRVVEEI
jgi:hypothetical protein